MRLSTTLKASLLLAACGALALPADATAYNTVKLDGYGSFSGIVVNTTLTGRNLPVAVDAWLGIDYATQPTGSGRFHPVTWPEPFDGVKSAAEFGKVCVQEASSSLPVEIQDEACLNFNVYRTQGVPLDQKLPVLVWIHGGAFVAGSYKSFDAASFAAYSATPVTVVQLHYRLNSLGFLPSALFEREGLLNLGVRDQDFFLRFVQKHIAAFGGDPDAVTIGGRSAGGHSVGIHYFHNYGEAATEKPLFARAIHQSGSVTARAFPNASYALYQRQYAEYVDFLGCSADDLDCLMAADIDQIRTISARLYNEYDPPLTWPFQPVQGGPLLEKFGSQSGIDQTFHKVPTITSSTTDEGKYYVPGTLETDADFIAYMHNISPALNATDLDLLAALYPDPATVPDSPYAGSPNSTQYNRLAAAWSDYAYICPSQETAYRASLPALAPVWKLRFDTNASWPAWRGVPHTSDTRYTWADETTQHPDVSRIYHAYLASFVATGDPNARRWPGSPEWPAYRPAGYGLDAPPPLQLVVRPDNATAVEHDAIRRAACLYWRDPERAPRLNK